MKKTNFFKLLMVGAMALALGFTGCQKGPSQADFDQLCRDVDALETKYDDLKEQLEGLSYVKSITTNDEGYLVTNSDNTTLQITVGGDGGGGNTTDLTGYVHIKNGNWWIGNVDTEKAANGVTPQIQIDDTTDPNKPVPYWTFPVIGADNKITWVRGANAVAASYAVELANGAGWDLYLPALDQKTLKGPIRIAGADSDINKIDILGWVEGYVKNAQGNYPARISLAGDVADESGFVPTNNHYPNAAAARATAYARYADQVVVHNTGRGYDFLQVNYAYVTSFWFDQNSQTHTPNTAEVDGRYASVPLTNAPTIRNWAAATGWGGYWNGGLETVKTKYVLTTLVTEGKGLLVQVHPITADFSTVEGLSLEDSQNHKIPLKLEKPILVSSLLTRAYDSSSAVYFVPLTHDGQEYNSWADYADEFTHEAVYSIVTPSGLRSEYTPFTIKTAPMESIENPLVSLVNKEPITPENGVTTPIGTPAVENPGAAGDMVTSFRVEKDYWYAPTFRATNIDLVNNMGGAPANGSGGSNIGNDNDVTKSEMGPSHVDDNSGTNVVLAGGTGAAPRPGHGKTNSVIDYYLEPADQTDFETDKFGIEFRNGGTEFKVTRLPDDMTLASFDLNVFKLGIDGAIYWERITIRPVRNELIIPLDHFEYVIEDDVPATLDDYLSVVQPISLAKMFTELEKVRDDGLSSSVDDFANMSQRWRSDTYGAFSAAISRVVIGGDEVDLATNAPLRRLIYGANGIANDADDLIIGYFNNDPGTAAGAMDIATNEDMYNMRSLAVQPQYSTDGTAAGYTFEIGERYDITVDFFESPTQGGDYINSVIISFTPVIPPLAELMKKNPAFWGGTNNVPDENLYAYYKVPRFWQENSPMATRYDIDQSFYNGDSRHGDSAPNIPNIEGDGGDGAFDILGNNWGVDRRWAALIFEIDDDKASADGIAATAGKTVEYAKRIAQDGQYTVPGPAPTLYVPGVTPLPVTNRIFEVYYQNDAPWADRSTVAPIFDDARSVNADMTIAGVPTGKEDAYGQPLKVVVDDSRYLNTYTYPADEAEDASFNIHIMSALYGRADNLPESTVNPKGKIQPTTGTEIVLPAAPTGNEWQLNDTHMEGRNYNNNRYSLFKFWNPTAATAGGTTTVAQAEYAYTYIRRVEFEVPNYSVNGPDGTPATKSYDWANVYLLLDANGNEVRTAVEIAPTATTGFDVEVTNPDNTTRTVKTGYLRLKGGQITSTQRAPLTVKVTDRFGKQLKQDITLVIPSVN